MKMELIEGSETSAIRTQTPGNYPKENILHIEHGESLKSRIREKVVISISSSTTSSKNVLFLLSFVWIQLYSYIERNEMISGERILKFKLKMKLL